MKTKKFFLASVLIHFGFLYSLSLTKSSSEQEAPVEVTLQEPTSGSEEAAEQQKQIQPKEPEAQGPECALWYGGIGIESNWDIVQKVVEGYPADKAGLKVGDRMFYKGDIRGEPGTEVHIHVQRNNLDLDFTIVRAKICYE